MRFSQSKIVRRFIVFMSLGLAANEGQASGSELGSNKPEIENSSQDVAEELWLPPTTDLTKGRIRDVDDQPDNKKSSTDFTFELHGQHFFYDLPFSNTVNAGSSDYVRGVADIRYTNKFAKNANFVFSNRLDILEPVNTFEAIAPAQSARNTLREAYFSYHFTGPKTSYFLDIGRVNIRNGVGSGSNPTDYFKDAAVLTSTSRDPNSLRLNRLGVVAANLQSVSEWGAFSFTAVPELAEKNTYDELSKDQSVWDLGLDRTNSTSTLLTKFSPTINERITLDLLIRWADNERAAAGFNLTGLLNNSLVTNIEVSAQKQRTLTGPIGPVSQEDWQARVAANLTWTNAYGLELTAEYIYAGDALDRKQWNAYRDTNDSVDIERLLSIQNQRSLEQEQLTASSYFLYAGARDLFGVNDLQVAGFITGNFYDNSYLWQLSARVRGMSGQWVELSAGLKVTTPVNSERQRWRITFLSTYQ